jgi:hypothetical protein
MATISALPPTLRDKLDVAARRVRLLRAVRGLSVLLLIVLLTAGAALLADALLDLPAKVREVVYTAWLCLAAVVAFIALVQPLGRRLRPEALAALIEEKFPHLGERLTTSVELADGRDAYHGSQALIALLMDETDARARRLDFLQAVPGRHVGTLATFACGVALLAFVPLLAWPDRYPDLVRRFFLPWEVTPAQAPYLVEVTPGDVITAHGRPLAVTAHLVPRKRNVALPGSATLVLTDADGNATRRPMVVERQDEFALKVDRVAGDFTYRVEAGEATSKSHQVTAVEPVELAAESPTITVTPPEYAKGTIPTQTLHGMQDLSALQYSRVAFDFRFTRPAVAGVVEWKPSKEKADVLGMTFPVELTPDRLGGRVELPVAVGASFRLVLKAEHDIATELDPRALAVQVDQPPVFTKVALTEELKAVLPYDRVPIEFTAADDVGVAEARVEYRVNGGPAQTESVVLKGAGKQEASARHLFELAGKVKEGDEVRYRLKVLDNRSLPEQKLGPQAVTYPEKDRWLVLKVARQAEPVRQQEIVAQRDEINKRLDAVREALLREQRALYKLRQESRNDAQLSPEHADALKEVRRQNRGAEDALREMAREAGKVPALERVAEGAQDVADKQMRRSDDALRTAEKDAEPPPRDADMRKADRELSDAVRRVEALRQANDRVAQARLDQMKLEMAAQREKALADRAAELAAKDPVKDPGAARDANDLRRDQDELANELDRLANQSEALRNALDAARAEEARKLAEKARELAKAQRELEKAGRDEDPRKDRLADLARQQQELAEKARKLADRTQDAAKAAQTPPAKAEEARKAAEALKRGDAGEAVKHQDQEAAELDRLAAMLDHAQDMARDPRVAARQLARMQDALKQRVAEAQRKHALTPEKQEAMAREEKAVARAAEALSVPPQNQPAKQDRKDAANQADRAADALAKKDAQQATAALEQSRQALERLANRLPSIGERMTQARAEVAKLRQQQDEIGRLADQAVKPAEKQDPKARAELAQRLAEAARRQADAAERLGKLDAPHHEARQARAQQALDRALADVMDARPQDVPASQAEAHRQLERLEQALNGQKPADEKARELADRQRRVADDAARAAADPKAAPAKQAELRAKQQAIAQETAQLQAPEAPQHHAEAADATRRADQAAAKPAEAEAAARALDRLARQLNGEESDADRAERLARRQAALAAEAERQAKQRPEAVPDAEGERHQAQVAEEAKQIHAGEEAPAEKQRAQQALSRAQQPANPTEQAKARRQAADALRKLADRLAGRDDPAAARQQPAEPAGHYTAAKPPDGSPRQMAQELARQQGELARTTQQSAAQPEPQRNQALDQAGRQQQRLNEEASHLPAPQAEKALEQAREAMNQARQALANHDAAQAGRKQQEAGDQLRRLADRLPDHAPEAARAEPAQPSGEMPGHEGSEEARRLAREQRALREAVQKAARAEPAPGRPGPVGELAKEQRQIARQAGDLAKHVAQEQGRQSPPGQHAAEAAHAAEQASDHMEAGALRQAQQNGEQAARQLRQLAAQMSQAPRGEQADAHAADPVQQARDLARHQEDVNRRLQAQAADPEARQAQQQARQQELQRRAGELAQQMSREAGQMTRSPQAMNSAFQAAQQAGQGQGHMQQAQAHARQGNQGRTEQAQEQAAAALDRAAERAEQAARFAAEAEQQAHPEAAPQSAQAGAAMHQAQGQARQAQQQLNQGQPHAAHGAMEQAAESLKQAAEQLAQDRGQPRQDGDPGPRGASGDGTVDASLLGPDGQKYAGKRWGELPGELRTKIIQDMKAKYGEDYARIIKLYFEQIADTKKK